MSVFRKEGNGKKVLLLLVLLISLAVFATACDGKGNPAESGAETQEAEIFDELDNNAGIQEVLPQEKNGEFKYRKLVIDDWQAWLAEQKQPVFLDFWATWCGPCKTALPLVDELAANFKDQVRVLKINVDVATEVAALYPTEGIPAFFAIKGEESKSWIGFGSTTFDEMRTYLKGLLKEEKSVEK